ncbi:unnamed protein product [Didymodactylos carnosus]|uniref:SSD domain-containing protein n=1 Tax=Didymodactylos carnosus TaxID=1234261 RepID=A0A814ZTD9_9BILA|nr:unnamed protein product [Didymodactylos carnosus]CAF1248013.1 unnamed protein product [Didymodactylos carnosus]CAF3743829.1 unnamed protein product [Didymodactylos carnosus]CAF4015288.1 unnamed protein product [Didymodactylos carnosus]
MARSQETTPTMPPIPDPLITDSLSFKNRYTIFKEKLNSNLNSYYDYLFDKYAQILSKYAWCILTLSLFITIILTACLYWAQLHPVDENVLKVKNSIAEHNAQQILDLFGNDSEYRIHQQVKLYPALDIILKRKTTTNGTTNMLVEEVITQMRELDRYIRSVMIVSNNQTYTYSQLCKKELNTNICAVDGGYLLTDKFYKQFSDYIPTGIYYDSGLTGYRNFMFGKNYNVEDLIEDYHDDEDDVNITTILPVKQEEKKIISYAPLFRLRYNLNTINESMKQLALEWEKLIIENLTLVDEKFNQLNIYTSVSTTVNSEISKYARLEAKSIGIMIIVFFLCTCFCVGIEGNWLTSVGYLPLFGIIGYALSTGATFGFLSLCKMSLLEPMTMLALIIGIMDCIRISIVCKEFHLTFCSLTIPLQKLPDDNNSPHSLTKRLKQTLKYSQPPFICTTIILCILYGLIFLISKISSIRIYSMAFCVYLFFNYFVHLTFFLSCLTITCRRINSNRHSLLCLKMSKIKPSTVSSSLSIIITTRFRPYFRSLYTKTFAYFICLLTIVLFFYSLVTVFKIDTRLVDSQFIPVQSHSLHSYMSSLEKDFDIGPVIMFTIPSALDYKNETIQRIQMIIEQCRNGMSTNDFNLFWYNWLDTNSQDQLTSSGGHNLSKISSLSTNNILLANDILLTNGTIQASRFYCQFKTIQGRRSDILTMDNMYRYSRQSEIPGLFPYSLVFSHYETLTLIITFHYVCLLSTLFTCLYLFHSLTINFANVFILFIVPGIFVDCFIHYGYRYLRKTNGENIKSRQCLFGYDRIFLSLFISLFVLIFFQIQSYTFIVLRNILFYYVVLTFIHLNIFLPLWLHLCKPRMAKTVSTTVATIEIPTMINGSGQHTALKLNSDLENGKPHQNVPITCKTDNH